MQTTQIQNVTYNPASRAFEARVSITEDGEIFTYPCALRAPMDMESTLAARRLVELALRRHAREARPTVSRRPENVFAAHIPDEVAHATDALWQRMLGHAA
ncbi:MAG: hypothetical protein VXY45_02775 [Pseudomonadota bacterium]|nr:hypothetical protein [Pseudomonadota bacterium]